MEYEIPLFDLVLTMSNAADLISSTVANHHKRVTYIVHCLTREMGLAQAEAQDAVIAASLHDLGAFSLAERVELLDFEITKPQQHAELGYAFFRDFAPLRPVAEIIRHHHVWWRDGQGLRHRGQDVPMASHIIHLADRIDVISFKVENILSRCDEIRDRIVAHRGLIFVPELVAAFERLADLEFFWLDLRSPALDDILQRAVEVESVRIDAAGIVELARLLSHMVDFKSHYTSTHTAGVAHSAEALAELMGLDGQRRQDVVLAGYLHDVGKLAIPREILDKPSGLDRDEFGMIKSHAYYTRRIVETIGGMGEIAEWASSHHEHLDGKGYPFHLSDLPIESRIIAVADVFTALAEDRPYRPGLTPPAIRRTLLEMVDDSKLDREVVQALIEHQEVVDGVRSRAQDTARAGFEEMLERARRIDAEARPGEGDRT